jgi:hypothetical protein
VNSPQQFPKIIRRRAVRISEALTMTNIELARLSDDTKSKRRREKPKFAPMSRVDSRLGAAKKFDAIVSGIVAELGGNLTIMQMGFVEAFAGCRISLDDLNARRLLGQPVDLAEYSTIASTMVSLSQRIDIERQHNAEA